ncbi:hydroxyacylglutathione hydrolase [Peptoniphilus olsenii]|uniref:Hydroxyacylglutathione hydrolase n=1 Tax=Peptoniphilus olsenii TaxID=411570 RepID=A0ABV2J9Z0_9FIRM
MNINAVKSFSDNYIWIIEISGEYIVVDPGEAKPVIEFLKTKPAAILLTHEHADHVGGVEEIKEEYGDVYVYGPSETEKFNSETVKEGSVFEILGKSFKVFDTPGHTMHHVSYLIDDKLFCGDALFLAGCGRVFTGDYESAFNTLKKFSELDDNILVYPAHEYSLANLEFTKAYRQSPAVLEEYNRIKELRDKEKITLPTTIGKEKQINPFMRAKDLEEFIDLRKLKDDF